MAGTVHRLAEVHPHRPGPRTSEARFPIYHVVGVNRPEAMREWAEQLISQGFRRFQVKVGSGHWQLDVERARACLDVVRDQEVVIVDANAYWRQHEAAQFIAALEDERSTWSSPAGRWRSAWRFVVAPRGQ